MVCRHNDCRARSKRYVNGCVALLDGQERDNCPFYKTFEQYNKEVEDLIKKGRYICSNSQEYEDYLYKEREVQDEEHGNNQ